MQEPCWGADGFGSPGEQQAGCAGFPEATAHPSITQLQPGSVAGLGSTVRELVENNVVRINR